MEVITLVYVGILALMICLVLTVLLLLVYSGLFSTIEVGAGKPPIGEVVIAYKYARGPYKESGGLFTEIMALAPDNKAIGVYYDDPKQVDPQQTRYIAGSVLAEGNLSVDEALKNKMIEEGFLVTKFPSVSNAVKTSFPYKCTLSIFIAVARVYPRLSEYIMDQKLCAHPFMEIYDGETIYFMAPLSRQDEFYVPEVKTGCDESFVSDDTCTEGDISSLSDILDESPSQLSSDGDMKGEGCSGTDVTELMTSIPHKGEHSDADKIKDNEGSMNDSGVSSENPQTRDSSLDGIGKCVVTETASDHSECSSFEEIHLEHVEPTEL